jgi:hypothetical protein
VLKPLHGRRVNLVNAMQIAEQRGWNVAEVTSALGPYRFDPHRTGDRLRA